MSVSSLSFTPPKLQTLQAFTTKPTTAATFKACSSHQSTPSINKKQIFQVGVGILAASIVSSAPLNADATRIEYYATTAEPTCEFNYVHSGLGYCDLAVGSGEEAPYNQLVNIHYTARFADGIVFDSSYKRGRALTMRLGMGKVIKGLDQGILGGEGVPPMLVGGKRKLQIPPHLAYGPEPAGCFSGDCNIPGNATLVYDIKFVDIYSGNRK
ncbi:Photosynthetic NDH subunit of lumenal location 4, chloroplastic [Capsicum chinense]|nr:Photosynthetic NDH subunit of lumenal location 4, chloroplastic [Capsicum annuum]PHU00746.1 Photosynthetic NDH subunit of lumenal location 4, chloroplastic [Capsicum chinense]